MRVEVSRINRRKQQAMRPAPPNGVPCGYCFQEWSTGYDHIKPWIHGGLDTADNLYPCCRRCNSILGAKIFDSLQAKREYVRQWLIERGEWKFPLPGLQETIPEETRPSEVLQPKVQMECVVQKKGTVVPLRGLKRDDLKERICKQVDDVPQETRTQIYGLRNELDVVDLSLLFDLSRACVHQIIKDSELPAILCAFCKTEFRPSRKNQRYCRSLCRWNEWDAAHPRTTRVSNEVEDFGG